MRYFLLSNTSNDVLHIKLALKLKYWDKTTRKCDASNGFQLGFKCAKALTTTLLLSIIANGLYKMYYAIYFYISIWYYWSNTQYTKCKQVNLS